MSQRHSEYRSTSDEFYTPKWVVDALLSVEHFGNPIWEPAPGEGHMLDALKTSGHQAFGTYDDFLQHDFSSPTARAIVTNPPYSRGLAGDFIRHAIGLMKSGQGKVAMLLPIGFDCAKTRRDIFADHPAFAAKHVLTKRIRWVNLEQKAAGPSSNHAWFIWDWRHRGPPQKGYLP